MKTNKILMAVALPALLAACTAEELVEQPANVNVSGRALLDPSFAINVVSGVDSRFTWDNYKWGWDDDTFGAGIVDPITPWEVSNRYMLGNFIYAETEAGWKTNSQMTEGVYMFYSYDGYTTKSDRGLVSFDLTNQKTDLDEPEAFLNDTKNQLFFSPLFNLEAKHSTEALPLEFRSFWGVAAFNFVNNTEQTLKITQIVLKEKNSTNQFIVKGGINPAALANKAQYVYNEKEGAYVPTQVNALIGKSGTTAKKIEKAYEEFNDNLLSVPASIITADMKDGAKSSFIALDCQEYELAEGEEVTAYMLVPAHDGKNIEVDIMVVDEKDKAKVVHVNNSMVSEISTLDILRDKTTAVFGKTVSGGIKPLKIVEKDLKDDAGFYINNNEDLKALLDKNHGAIQIHNSGDVVIDEEISEAIREYLGTSVTFTQPINVSASVALVDDSEEGSELALDKVNFLETVTVKGENEDEGINGTVEFNNVNVYKELIVEEGATVTLYDGYYANVRSNGNLTIVADDAIVASREVTGVEAITVEAGTLTIKGELEPVIDLKNGTLNYVTNKKANTCKVSNVNLTTAAGTTVNVGDYVTMSIDKADVIGLKKANNNGYETEASRSTWTIDGNLELNAELKVYGDLKVNGVVEGKGTLTASNTVLAQPTNANINNTKTIGANIEIAKGASIECKVVNVDTECVVKNGGEFGETQTLALVNNGLIEMTEYTSRVTVTSGNGEIDNTGNGVVDMPEGMTVFAVFAEDMDNFDELSSYRASSKVNKMIVKGTWNIKKETGVSSGTGLGMYMYDELTIESIEFDGGELNVAEKFVFNLQKKEGNVKTSIPVTISNDAIWNGRQQETSVLKGISVLTIKKDDNDKFYDLNINKLNVDVNYDGVQTLYGDYYYASVPTAETIQAHETALRSKMILEEAEWDFGGKTVKNLVLTTKSPASEGDGKSIVKVESEATFEGCEFAAPSTNYDIRVLANLNLKDCDFLTATNNVFNKNKVAKGKRALYIGASVEVNAEECQFEDKVYAYNVYGNADPNVYFKGGYLRGWMSGAGTFEFDGCQFGKSGSYADLIPYGNVTFKGCKFDRGFEISLLKSGGCTISFDKSCYYGGALITEPGDVAWSYDGGQDGDKANGKTTIKIAKNSWLYSVESGKNDTEFDDYYFDEID